MTELFNFMRVTVGIDKLTARIMVNPDVPLRTSEDVEATARVYYLAPAIADHVCLGDTGAKFQDCMGDTELPHLLEHLTVEILNKTGLAGDITSGRTRTIPGDERLFDVEISCTDDALTIGALSSAAFMMNWAFLYPDQMPPDVDGTVEGLRQLALGMRDEGVAGVAASAEAPEETSAAAPASGAPGEAAYREAPGYIDTEGVAAIEHEGAGAVFGGAAVEGSYAIGPDPADPESTVQMQPLGVD